MQEQTGKGFIKRGGGVALAFRAYVCNFKGRKTKKMASFEIMCAVGTAGKIKRKLVVFIAYLTPQMSATSLDQFNELLGCEIAEAKVCYGDPIIVLVGDMNGRDLSGALDIDGEISLVVTDPMRGPSTLDLVYTNETGRVTEKKVRQPLETEDGKLSDHGCVRIKIVMPAVKNFTYVRKTVRKRTTEGDTAFGAELACIDWSPLRGFPPDDMVREFEAKIEEITNKHCPLKSIRVRSIENPWITNGIRRRSRKKKGLDKREGRSLAWQQADNMLAEEVAEKKLEFVEETINLPEKNFYTAVKKLRSPRGTLKPWSVRDLFPSVDAKEVGKSVLDYFPGVGGSKAPSPVPEIRGCGAGLGVFDATRVESLLRAHKKVNLGSTAIPCPILSTDSLNSLPCLS